MKRILHHGFTLFLIIVVAGALYLSRKWNPTTALFPRTVGFPVLALLLAIFAVDLKKEWSGKENSGTKGEGDKAYGAKVGLSVIYLAWLGGFIALAWAIGLLYSIPVYILSYMKVQGKYGWLQSGVYAVAATVFAILFAYILQMAWPEGALLSL